MKNHLSALQPHLRQKGIAGLTEYIDRPDHSLLTRLLTVVDKKFIGLAHFAQDWVHFESQIAERGIPEVAREFYGYLGMELQINDLPGEFSSPNKPAILMGLNHEAIVEPIVLVSLLNRDDIKFPGVLIFKYLGPHIAEIILPVLPKKFATDYGGDSKPTLSNKLDPIYQLYALENRSSAEIERLNQWSLQQAADHLSGGGVLLIFPTGGQSIDHSWYPGLGHILNKLQPGILPLTPIYPISINGLSRKLIYRKIHQAAFDKRQVDPLMVNILEPIHLPPCAEFSPADQLLDYVRKETNIRLKSSSRLRTNSHSGQVGTARQLAHVSKETFI